MDKERILLLVINFNGQDTEEEIEYKIDELRELVRASGGQVVGSVTQNLSALNSRFLIGSGKAQEIAEIVENNDIDGLIVNTELTGSQMKNLEDVVKCKILDRTGLILDIFARRAKTKEAKLQVKLAQLEYRLPRLVGFRNYLSREGGGIGTRGPGEQKLETDRRALQREISSIKYKLKDVSLKRDTKRKKRVNSPIPVVSLIGYSNSGKSTILNKLTQRIAGNDKEVYADDMLFATLETSARQIQLNSGKEIVVSDTVGFISDLPTKLVESFKSTLEEIEDSDLLLIVVDRSNPAYRSQVQTTQKIIHDMKLAYKKILYVFNKIDLVDDYLDYNDFENEIYISALRDEDIEKLLENIESLLFDDYFHYKAFVPYEYYDRIKSLVPLDRKAEEEFLAYGVETVLYLNKDDKKKYEKFIIGGQ